MKSLNQYITETTYNKWGYEHKIKIKYHPETKEELQKIIERKCIAITRNNTKTNKSLNLTDIDVSKITDMSDLFEFFNDNHKFNIITNIYAYNWDVSNVTDMSGMFYGLSYIEHIAFEDWDVSKVKTMKKMFGHMKKLNVDLSKWKLTDIKNTDEMFCWCQSLHCDLSNWSKYKPDSYENMFLDCENYLSEKDYLPKWYDGRIEWSSELKRKQKNGPDLFWNGPGGPHINVNSRNYNKY